MTDYVAMGRQLKRRRQMLKLTQDELAKMCNVSSSFYGHIERGTRIPSLDTMVLLANALSARLDDLLSNSLTASRDGESPARRQDTLREYLAEQNVIEINWREEVESARERDACESSK